MRTIPRNATKVIAGIRETCTTFNLFVEIDGAWSRVPTSSGRDMDLAFETLAQNKEARLVEFEAGRSYGITFGGTRWTRKRHMITLTVPASVKAGMETVTYRPDHGDLTVPADVLRVFVHLDDQGAPVTMAEIVCDGLAITTEADKVNPGPWVRMPSAEYLAEQAAIEAAAEQASAEEQEEAAGPNGCESCGAGPYEPCTDEIATEEEEEEESTPREINGLREGMKGITFTDTDGIRRMLQELYCLHETQGELLADFVCEGIDWTAPISQISPKSFTPGIPVTSVPKMCVCPWWIPDGAETAHLQEVKPECSVHGAESHQEETETAPGLVVTESAQQELRELVTAWRQAANPTREWEIGMDLVVAVEALLEQREPTA